MSGNGASSNSSMPGKSKLLSVCITGRDDDYMLDFRYRITTTLNYIARNLKRLSRLDDVELLVTDWGSEVPMAQTLQLTPEAAEISRFIYVPPVIVRAAQNGGNGFHISCATNTGLRRAEGEFLMVSAADTLIPQHSLESVLNLLEGKYDLPIDVRWTYFLLRRYQVLWQFVQRQPDLAEWDRYLLLNASELQREEGALFGVSKGAGALMLSRLLWHDLGGLDERLGGWGWNDIELGLRVSQCYPWLELSSIGVWLLHMEHLVEGSRASIVKNTENLPIYNSAFRANNERWGLGDCDLEIQTSQNVCAFEKPAEPIASRLNLQSEEIKSWNQSRQEISDELGGLKVRNHVKQVIELADKTGWDVDPDDIDSLTFLSWYSLYYYPRRYIDFGLKQGYAAAAVAVAYPSVEIYGIDRWEGPLERHAPKNIATDLRRLAGHQGYVRFINGDMTTATQRLRKSFVGPFCFDLALVHGDTFETNASKQVCDLLAHLSAGGALVFVCKSIKQLDSLWNEIRPVFPQFTYFRRNNAGLILAATLKDEKHGQTADESVSFDTGWIWRSRVKCQSIRLYRALKRPHMYLQYARRVYNVLNSKAHS